MGYFRFVYTDRTFYRPVPFPMLKKHTQKSFKFLFKSKTFTVIMSKMRVLGQKN